MDNRYLVFDGLGAGDFLAVESFWREEERDALQVILWDASCRHFLEPAIKANPRYRKVRHLDISALKSSPLPYTLSRWHVVASRRPLVGSSFLKHTESPIALPDRYHVVVDSSPKNPIEQRYLRDYQGDDWPNTLAQLEARGSIGVVLNSEGGPPVPKHERLINLTGQTSFMKSIAILKRCAGYIGIDSCLATLAIQVAPLNEVIVRTVNPYQYEPYSLFYAPLTAEQRRYMLCPSIPSPEVRPPDLPSPESQTRPLTKGMKFIVLSEGIYQIVNRRVYSPGDVVEIEDDRAKQLIDLGHARYHDPNAVAPEPLIEAPKIERARSTRATKRSTRLQVEDK